MSPSGGREVCEGSPRPFPTPSPGGRSMGSATHSALRRVCCIMHEFEPAKGACLRPSCPLPMKTFYEGCTGHVILTYETNANVHMRSWPGLLQTVYRLWVILQTIFTPVCVIVGDISLRVQSEREVDRVT